MVIIKALKSLDTKDTFNMNHFYGVGLYKSRYLAKVLGLLSIKKNNLKFLQKRRFIWNILKKDINKDFLIGNVLKEKNKSDRKVLSSIECLRGERFRKGLPCNGQRTQTNSRTTKKLAGLIDMRKKKKYAVKKIR